MYRYEKALLAEGKTHIAGCDEVGRGPLAGPLVAASVILNPDDLIIGLNDSKQLSIAKRHSLYQAIMDRALSVSIAVVDVETVDKINVYKASQLALESSVLKLSITPDYVLIDAMKLTLPIPSKSIIKGDTLSASIAAASIVAKVTRDKMMIDLSIKYPKYGFEHHKGYPTKKHLAALKKYGATPIHRKSFGPVKALSQTQIEL